MSDAHALARTDRYHHRSSRRVCLTMGMALALVASMAAVGQAAPIGPSFIVPFQRDTGGTLPSDLATGDVNGDGRADAVVANLGPAAFNGGVAVHLGDGAGHLGAAVPTALPDGWGASNLAVADYNRDGKDDLAVQAGNTSGPGPLVMLLATSGGHFAVGQQFASGTGVLVAADFNQDAKPDLAFASTPSGGELATVTIRFGDGQGNLGPAVAYPSQFFGAFYDVAAGDMNGDGFPDLVLATGGSPAVLLNQGDGTFGAYLTSASPLLQGIALALADFNGDGKLDVALGDASGGHVEIGLGTGDGHFTPVAQYERHRAAGPVPGGRRLHGRRSPGRRGEHRLRQRPAVEGEGERNLRGGVDLADRRPGHHHCGSERRRSPGPACLQQGSRRGVRVAEPRPREVPGAAGLPGRGVGRARQRGRQR